MMKLGHLVAKFDERVSVPQPTRSPQVPEQYAHGVMHSSARHSSARQHNLSLKLSSKIPLSSGEMATVPMLSPKTPHVGELEYSPFAGNLIQDSDLSMGQAMEALQLYAQQPAAQLPPTPDVYILQHGQFTAGGTHAMQTPHPLTMPPPNMMPVTSPMMHVSSPMNPVTSPMNPVTGPMMPVTSPISAENMYSLQMQCARLTSPDSAVTMVTNEAQFPGSYHMDKNASFYPSADPFRATQNLYDMQHSGGNVSAGWFAPPPHIGELQYAVAPQTEQTVTVVAADNVPIESVDAAMASRPSKKIFRTKAYSLNPEEREALENLIEDVIIGGVDNEVMTSDDSDSESDSDPCDKVGSENKDGNENAADREGLPKVYPAQLKVAVKHMKNLPPRFLKKIHAAPKTENPDDVDLTFEVKSPEEKTELRTMEREREKNIKVEGQKRDIKKKIRNMLQGLDSYVEENVVLVEEECQETCDSVDVVAEEPPEEVPVSLAPVVPDTESKKVPTRDSSPMLGAPAQRIVLKPNVINCSDLERELLGEPPSHAERKSTFSIDAPEFVPRSFTPIAQCCASPVPVACPPATTSPYRASAHGHNSPQPFVSSQLHLSHSQINGPVQRRSPTPAYMLPKVAYPVSTPATVVRMRFPQYPPPTYNAAAIPQFNPILQPSFVPPGFGMQDLGAAAQGVYPVYMSPQVKPVNPYVLSPHSSPKAMHRVIDSNVIHGMQPILIPQHVPRLSPNAQLADPNYNALYTAGLANMYRHLSPHSSPKVRRSGTVDGDVDRSAVAALKLKVHGLIASGKNVMIVMRGLSGSGKSTLAR